ncbi:uncharacterized protein WM277_016508 isoform 1-T1 [Molossus nigricans]
MVVTSYSGLLEDQMETARSGSKSARSQGRSTLRRRHHHLAGVLTIRRPGEKKTECKLHDNRYFCLFAAITLVPRRVPGTVNVQEILVAGVNTLTSAVPDTAYAFSQLIFTTVQDTGTLKTGCIPGHLCYRHQQLLWDEENSENHPDVGILRPMSHLNFRMNGGVHTK